MKWNIDYQNDATYDGVFSEWWEVFDASYPDDESVTKLFKCDSKADAEWLAGILNAVDGEKT